MVDHKYNPDTQELTFFLPGGKVYVVHGPDLEELSLQLAMAYEYYYSAHATHPDYLAATERMMREKRAHDAWLRDGGRLMDERRTTDKVHG